MAHASKEVDQDAPQLPIDTFFTQFAVSSQTSPRNRLDPLTPGTCSSAYPENLYESHFISFLLRDYAAQRSAGTKTTAAPHPQQDDSLHASVTEIAKLSRDCTRAAVEGIMTGVDGKASPNLEALPLKGGETNKANNLTVSISQPDGTSKSPSPSSERIGHSDQASDTPASQCSTGPRKRKRELDASATPTQRSKSPRTLSELQDAFEMRSTRSPTKRVITNTDPPPSSSVLSNLGSKSPSAPDLSTQQSLPVSSSASRSKAVRSSQSEEDEDDVFIPDISNRDLDSESESSDEDLRTFLARRRKGTTAETPVVKKENGGDVPATAFNTRLRSKISDTSATPRSQSPLNANSKPKVYKNSLMSLVEQARRDTAAQAEFEKVYAELTAPGLAEDEVPNAETTQQGIKFEKPSEDMLASVVKDEEEGEDRVGRMLQAMDRIDAFQLETVWHFFKGCGATSAATVPNFPLHNEAESHVTALAKGHFRDQAFTSGFAAELINDFNLPHEVPREILDWVWDAYFVEPRDEVAHGYLQCLKTCYPYWNRLIEIDHIKRIMERLGAFDCSIDFDQDIIPNQRQDASMSRSSTTTILRFFRVIGDMNGSLSQDGKTYALGIILRLSLDKDITAPTTVGIALRETLVNLVDSFPELLLDATLYEIATCFHAHLANPILQHRLVDSIPPSSPRLHLFRRRLALTFFLNDSALLLHTLGPPLHSSPSRPTSSSSTARPNDQGLSKRIIDKLADSAAFDTTDVQLDYSALGAYIAMLDVGIDCGFAPTVSELVQHRELSSSKTDTAKTVVDEATATKQGLKDCESCFNESVDAIVAEVYGLWSRIIDTGAAHMARTDAKNVLERLKRRLEYGVRTKVKKRRSMFEGSGGLSGRASLTSGPRGVPSGFEESTLGASQKLFQAWRLGNKKEMSSDSKSQAK